MSNGVMAGPTLATDLHAFEEQVIDLVLGTERMLLDLCQALEVGSDQLVRWTLGSAGAMHEAYTSLQTRGLALQARYAPVGGLLTRLIELQQGLSEFGRIAEHCKLAANHALAVTGTGAAAERCWSGEHYGSSPAARVPHAALSLLRALQRQMRCVIVALVRSDHQQEQRLITEAQSVGNYCAVAVVELQERIAADASAALSLTRLLFMVYELRCIHERLIAIGRGLRYSAVVPSPIAI
jgi:hypothetical protein